MSSWICCALGGTSVKLRPPSLISRSVIRSLPFLMEA